MLGSLKLQKKIVAIWSLFSLLLNMFQPAFVALTLAPIITPQSVQAEDATESASTLDPTPTPTPTTEPSVEPTATPTESIAPSAEPSVEPSVSPDPTPAATIEPVASVEPSVEPSSTPTPAPSDTPSNPEPGQDSSPAPPSAEPTPSPSPSATPTPSLNEQLSISIVENTAAESIEEFDLTVTETGSATLVTDKADYAPTDTAIITGHDFLPNTLYSLTVSSTDEPATSTTVDITTDESGGLFYAYQLDGIYRPNYKVEAFLSTTLVAAVTFTDSYVVGNYLCENDAQGANDEPGQKDLTKMCYDTTSTDPLKIIWNWDDKGPGGNVGGNTGDACSLFDTDNDGFANYSMCVIIDGDPSIYQNKALYSCGDSKSDRCTNPVTISAGTITSTCTANTQNTDPFSNGTNNPIDSVADCTINLSDVGGVSSAKLIDVCSYPSQQPNSDPSDCIIAATTQDRGSITVIKDLYPSNDSGRFNLQIDGENFATNVGDGGSTGAIDFAVGTHSIGEVAYTGTDLANYTTSISCVSGNTSEGTANNAGPLNVVLSKNENIVCTITNTRINNASLTIIKDAVPNDPQDFSFTTTGTGLSSFSLDDDSDATLSNTRVFSNLGAGNYSVSEQAVAGWVQTSATCSDGSLVSAINLSSGENVTCTFTNTKQPTLTVTKVVTNNNGGQLTASSFPLFVDGNSVTSGATNTYAPGTYTISETEQPGYTQTSLTCNSDKVNPVVLNAGDNVACTITNDDQPGTLIIRKVVVGSDADESNFTYQVNNATAISFESDGENQQSVNAGNYTITEPAVAGYSTSYSNCNVTVTNGETEICTITNTKIPTLTVNKILLNNSIVSETGKFNLKIDGVTYANDVGNGGTTGTQEVALGAHTVSETAGTGTDMTLYSATIGGACSSDGSVTLSAGENKVCTITNVRKTGKVLIDKILYNDEGPALESDWDFTLLGQTFHDGDYVILPTGTYSITEVQDVAGYTLSSIGGICTNLQDSTATLTVSETTGENYQTCSFTNTRDKGAVVVNKMVDTDNDGSYEGGNSEANVLGFTWSLNGGSATAMGTSITNIPTTISGVTYSVNENNVSGYHFTGWYPTGSTQYSCSSPQGTSLPVPVEVVKDQTSSITFCNARDTGTIIVHKDVQGPAGEDITDTSKNFIVTLDGSNSQQITDNGTVTYSNIPTGSHAIAEPIIPAGYNLYSITSSPVTVVYGETAHVYIINRQVAANLILIKHLPNDNGGTAIQSDFPVKIDNTAAVWGENTVNPGSYTVSETTLPGYSPSAWSNGCASDGSVTLLPGQTKTCEITNDDIAPTLKLVKNVTINSNGNETPASWTLTATGAEGFSDSGNSITFHTVKAGVGYVLSESNIPGYTASSWSCNGGSLVGNTITLGLDDDVTCQITNTDIAPTLTVIKHVSNDNGGNAVVTDFDLEINDQDLTFGAGTTDNSVTSYTANPSVVANTSYTLTEIDLAGYNEGSFSCYDNNSKQSVDHPLTLSEGQSVTCEIRNDDIAPQLTLIKNVIKDNGGSANPDDFNLTVGGTPVLSGVKNTYTANTPLSINETLLSGYSFVSITGSAKCPSVLGGTITLDEGDDLSCTITNDDQPGTLTVTKVTLPTDTNPTFSITATGSGVIAGNATRGIQDGTPVVYTVDAGSYDVSEVAAAGWDETGNTCNDVVVVNGGNSSCTIENTQRGHLIVQKTTTPADSQTFSITASGTGTITGGGAGTISDTTDHDYEVTPGTYSVSETNLPGNWDETSNNCDDIVVSAGETEYCTIANTKRGNVVVIKYHDHNGDGTQDEGDEVLNNWEMHLVGDNVDAYQWTGNGDPAVAGQVTFSDLVPDTYTLSEQLEEGWVQTNISCASDETTVIDNDNSHSAIVDPGSTTTCSIGNFELGRIAGYKYEDSNGDGDWDDGEDPLPNWTIYLGTASATTDINGYFEFSELLAGDYELSEDETNLDYARTEPDSESGIYNITVSSGTGYGEDSENYYYFGNAPLTDIHGYKWNDVNGNGERDCTLFDELFRFDLNQECEDLLGDWTIFLDKNGNETLDEGEQSTTTEDDEESDHFGWYWFYDLFPGEYSICEVQQAGWQQTYPLGEETVCHHITVPNDNQQTENGVTGPEYHFGNQAEPKLRIQKSNDATGNQNPGDIVTYTLKVDLTGSSLAEVIVTDVTPDGFAYVAGSWTADKNGSPLVISEPNYASPGTWYLGEMVDGDMITLTYQAKIDSNQDGGTYNDIAWAEGTSRGWGTVLAEGHDSEYVDDIFVGTDVVINKSTDETGTVDIEKTGEVLGASTELPATGAPTLWLLLAISLLITGLALTLGGKRMKQITLATILAVSLWHGVTAPVLAADPDNMLSVRVEQPQSPTRVTDWNLSFSVLDRNPESFPSVTCYVKKPAGAFISFGAVHLATKDVGDNGFCHVDSSVMSEKGTYQFYVTATSGSLSEDSSIVSVNYSNDGPGVPTSYSKDHPESCKYVIKFHTANDGGLTTKVKIYSSDQTNFDTHSGTQVGEVSIGSDQNGEFTHNRSSDCDKTWYYVIRAFDSAGNQSGHRGDEVVTITTVSPSPTTTALVVTTANSGTVLGSDRASDDKDGEVLGEDQAESSPESVEGQGLVTKVAASAQNLLKNKSFWWIVLVIIALRIVYGILRKDTKK